LSRQQGNHPRLRKGLTEQDRMAIAQTIREHLKLCQWEFSKPSESKQ
jgi:hypothetical protein